MARLATHGSNLLDFFSGAVGKVAWVGVVTHVWWLRWKFGLI